MLCDASWSSVADSVEGDSAGPNGGDALDCAAAGASECDGFFRCIDAILVRLRDPSLGK